MVAPINNNHVQIMSNLAHLIRQGENPLNNIDPILIGAVASRLDRDGFMRDMRLPVPNAAGMIMSVVGEIIGQGMMGGLSANDASTLSNYLNQHAEAVQHVVFQAARERVENPHHAIEVGRMGHGIVEQHDAVPAGGIVEDLAAAGVENPHHAIEAGGMGRHGIDLLAGAARMMEGIFHMFGNHAPAANHENNAPDDEALGGV